MDSQKTIESITPSSGNQNNKIKILAKDFARSEKRFVVLPRDLRAAIAFLYLRNNQSTDDESSSDDESIDIFSLRDFKLSSNLSSHECHTENCHADSTSLCNVCGYMFCTYHAHHHKDPTRCKWPACNTMVTTNHYYCENHWNMIPHK